MSQENVIVCGDLEGLTRRAAAEFVSLARNSAVESGRFAVALSGGSTPRGLYSLLSTPEFRDQVPWHQAHLFWGDERCVPPDHPESNYGMVRNALLARISIPEENVHRMKGEADPEASALEYEQSLREFFRLAGGELPRFDLILLGLGQDGHTASLFPGIEVLQERRRLVAAVYVERMKSHRLTLTLPVLNHGANVFFLVAGKEKAPVLRDVLRGKSRPEPLPAERVQPQHGRLVWLVEQGATALLAEGDGRLRSQ